MKIILTVAFVFICVLYCDIANAEAIMGGNIEIERDPNEIRIIFTASDPRHASATYIRYTPDDGRPGTSELIVRRRAQSPIYIRIDADDNFTSVVTGDRRYSCRNGRNSILCASARPFFEFWALRLAIERRIEEAMQMPVFDFGPYMPPPEETPVPERGRRR